VERLLEHGAPVDRVEGRQALEPALELLDERALARADRSHEVEHLAALLALERGGVEVADDLVDRLLDAEELVLEEVVDLERLVLEEPLHARVVAFEDVVAARLQDHVVHAGAGDFEVLEERPAPVLRLARRAVFFDDLLERGIVHGLAPPRLVAGGQGPARPVGPPTTASWVLGKFMAVTQRGGRGPGSWYRR